MIRGSAWCEVCKAYGDHRTDICERADDVTLILAKLRDDGSDLAFELEHWAEHDFNEGRHTLEMDAHVAASAIRRKIADLLAPALASEQRPEGE